MSAFSTEKGGTVVAPKKDMGIDGMENGEEIGGGGVCVVDSSTNGLSFVGGGPASFIPKNWPKLSPKRNGLSTENGAKDIGITTLSFSICSFNDLFFRFSSSNCCCNILIALFNKTGLPSDVADIGLGVDGSPLPESKNVVNSGKDDDVGGGEGTVMTRVGLVVSLHVETPTVGSGDDGTASGTTDIGALIFISRFSCFVRFVSSSSSICSFLFISSLSTSSLFPQKPNISLTFLSTFLFLPVKHFLFT